MLPRLCHTGPEAIVSCLLSRLVQTNRASHLLYLISWLLVQQALGTSSITSDTQSTAHEQSNDPKNFLLNSVDLKCERRTSFRVDDDNTATVTQCCDDRFEGHIVIVANHLHLLKHWHEDEWREILGPYTPDFLMKVYAEARLFKEDCSVTASYFAHYCTNFTYQQELRSFLWPIDKKLQLNVRLTGETSTPCGDRRSRFDREFTSDRYCRDKTDSYHNSSVEMSLAKFLAESLRLVKLLKKKSPSKILLILITAGQLRQSSEQTSSATDKGSTAKIRELRSWKESVEDLAKMKNLEVVVVRPNVTDYELFGQHTVETLDHIAIRISLRDQERLAPQRSILAGQLVTELPKLLRKQFCANFTDCRQNVSSEAADSLCLMKIDSEGELRCFRRNQTSAVVEAAEHGRPCDEVKFEIDCVADVECRRNCANKTWATIFYCKNELGDVLPTAWANKMGCKTQESGEIALETLKFCSEWTTSSASTVGTIETSVSPTTTTAGNDAETQKTETRDESVDTTGSSSSVSTTTLQPTVRTTSETKQFSTRTTKPTESSTKQEEYSVSEEQAVRLDSNSDQNAGATTVQPWVVGLIAVVIVVFVVVLLVGVFFCCRQMFRRGKKKRGTRSSCPDRTISSNVQ